MSVLAVDFGGSHVGCAVVREGEVLASSSIGTDARSLTQLFPALKTALLQSCRAAGISSRDCVGIGIGFPGVVDSHSSEILSTLGKFDDISAEDLRGWCEREFQLPMKIENDASLALSGEHAAGAARGFEDVVMITLGTGIGVGTMLNGALLRSRLGQAGSIAGHLPVRVGGRRCVCGGIGCAEAEASTAVLPVICKEWPGFAGSALSQESNLDFATLFRLKDAGDRVAGDVIAHCIAVWSVLSVSLIHAYGPELLLLGGGVMKRGEEILGPIRAYVGQYAWKTSRGIARIGASLLGVYAALIGAESLFREGRL